MMTKHLHNLAQPTGRLYRAAFVVCQSRIVGFEGSWALNRLEGLDFAGTPMGAPV